MPSDAPGTIIWTPVLGQERVKRILAAALHAHRLPHALLFHGPEGVGKDAMAIELARVIHCERNSDEACGECDSCTRLRSLQHPDVRLVVALPVGKGEKGNDPPLARLTEEDLAGVREQLRLKAENHYHRITVSRATVIKINSIRELRREASLTTTGGRRRIFIVSRADEMGEEASNTILKTLEEPPGSSLLILTSANPDALLPTIRSRCQHIRFDPLTEGEIAGALRNRVGVPPDAAALVARLAGGSYTRALALLDEDLVRERQEITAFVRLALSEQVGPLAAELERRSGTRDRDGTARFLQMLLIWFRDAMVLSRGGAVINLDQQADLQRFVSRFPAANLTDMMAEVDRALFLLDRNVYIKLILTHLALRLKQLVKH